LLDGDGILLGHVKRQIFVHARTTGCNPVRTTQIGKGVGRGPYPTLLNFPRLCYRGGYKAGKLGDYRQDSGQNTDQQVYLFDPLSETGDTARWNPLFYVSDDANIRINDIQRIAEMLYLSETGKDSFWGKQFQDAILGI